MYMPPGRLILFHQMGMIDTKTDKRYALECPLCYGGDFYFCKPCHNTPGVHCYDKAHSSRLVRCQGLLGQLPCPHVKVPPHDRPMKCTRCLNEIETCYIRESIPPAIATDVGLCIPLKRKR